MGSCRIHPLWTMFCLIFNTGFHSRPIVGAKCNCQVWPDHYEQIDIYIRWFKPEVLNIRHRAQNQPSKDSNPAHWMSLENVKRSIFLIG